MVSLPHQGKRGGDARADKVSLVDEIGMYARTGRISTDARGGCCGTLSGVRSVLEIRSPSNGTGWADWWAFSGADDRLLRDCLEDLAEYTTEPPVTKADRWRAAVLFSDDDKAVHMGIDAAPSAEIRAWTSDGALHLAEILPARFASVRDAIIRRFDQA
jgi:hypothetical protein